MIILLIVIIIIIKITVSNIGRKKVNSKFNLIKRDSYLIKVSVENKDVFEGLHWYSTKQLVKDKQSVLQP